MPTKPHQRRKKDKLHISSLVMYQLNNRHIPPTNWHGVPGCQTRLRLRMNRHWLWRQVDYFKFWHLIARSLVSAMPPDCDVSSFFEIITRGCSLAARSARKTAGTDPPSQHKRQPPGTAGRCVRLPFFVWFFTPCDLRPPLYNRTPGDVYVKEEET